MNVSWPNLLQAWNYIKSRITSASSGLYIIIKDTSGGSYSFHIGNNPSGTLVISNVPPDKVSLLESWLLDCWNYLDGLYEGRAYGLNPLQLVSAHINGKPIPPDQSYKYVIQGKNIFSGNLFQRNERSYQQYLKKNLPGYNTYQKVLNEIASFINHLKSLQAQGYNVSDYIEQAEDIRNYLERSQISPERALQELTNLKKSVSSLNIFQNLANQAVHTFVPTPPKPHVIHVTVPPNTSHTVYYAIQSALKRAAASNASPRQIQEAVNQAVKAKSPTEAYNTIINAISHKTATAAPGEKAGEQNMYNLLDEIAPAILTFAAVFMLLYALPKLIHSSGGR